MRRAPDPPLARVQAMSDFPRREIDRLPGRLRAGERSAFDELVPLVYDELHHVAGQQRRRWQGDDSLNTTGLVHLPPRIAPTALTDRSCAYGADRQVVRLRR